MFSAKEETLHQVFKEKRYQVPYYQRPYSWQVENAENLWDDLYQSWSEEASEAQGYFLGSVVLVSRENSERDDIVDGQQRFLTLQLLLSALASVIGEGKTKGNLMTYVASEEDEFAGTKAELVVEPGSRFIKAYKSVVSNKDIEADDEQAAQSFIRNIEVFRDRARDLSKEDLLSFAKFVVQKAHFAVLRADSEVQALRIFTVLNDRGLDLHSVDILKAQLLERASVDERKKQKLAADWEEWEEDLGRKGFQDLISHIRTSYVRGRSKVPLHDDIMENLKTKKSVEDFLSVDLPAFVKANEDLIGSHKLEISNLREIGRKSGFKEWEAAAVFILRNKKRISDTTDILRKLAAVVAFLAITKATDGQRIGRIGRIIEQIDVLRLQTNSSKTLTNLVLSSSDWASFQQSASGDAYSARGLKAAMLWLESISGDKERELGSGEVTIEHLLPRAVGDDKHWSKAFDPEVWQNSSNRLGNLLLVSGRSNRKMGRKSFDDKKAYIAEKGGSPWVWTQDALKQAKWGLPEIEAREARMLKKAKTYFQV